MKNIYKTLEMVLLVAISLYVSGFQVNCGHRYDPQTSIFDLWRLDKLALAQIYGLIDMEMEQSQQQ